MDSKDDINRLNTGYPLRRSRNRGDRRFNDGNSAGRKSSGDARHGSARVLDTFESGGHIAPALAAFASGVRMDDRNRSLMKKLVSGVLQNRSLLDFRIDELLDSKRARLPVTVRNILRTAFYQILFLDGIPEWAVVSEAVRLAGETGFYRLKGLTNGVLRSFLRSGITKDSALDGLTPGSVECLSVKYSHPAWLVERWVEQFGLEETSELLKMNNRTPPVTFQVNTLRISPADFVDELAASGIEAEKSKPDGTGYNVTGRLDMRVLDSFLRGGIYVQDESGAQIARMNPDDPSLSVIDLCAAPGGKIITSAINREDGGRMIAGDLDAARIRLLKENTERLRLKSILPVVADGRVLPFAGRFDVVLVDAPCTGTGTLRRKADLRWRITPSWLENLPSIQVSLLESAAAMVAPGGKIIYSTCSIEREENTDTITSFLDRHPEFLIEPPPPRDFTSFTRRDGTVQFLPHRDGCDGAFAANLRCA